ncbi:aminotransferase class V-fold PLP-dependent enzyme [Candidatus Poribacteria bacterium]|nr:aminotransferase class V-fold PLP-dependent enzyme [Candidatus Poribacteria bacterium]
MSVTVLVDAPQSIAHEPHDVRELGCDYMVFSGQLIPLTRFYQKCTS